MTADQFERLMAAIEALRDHSVDWKRLFIAALPTFLATFLASVLGFATALLLGRLKTERENRKVTRERLEKELAQLSAASTVMGFNVEALTHTFYQQDITPLRGESRYFAACRENKSKRPVG
jgi:Na+-driven multidrug efflux pump